MRCAGLRLGTSPLVRTPVDRTPSDALAAQGSSSRRSQVSRTPWTHHQTGCGHLSAAGVSLKPPRWHRSMQQRRASRVEEGISEPQPRDSTATGHAAADGNGNSSSSLHHQLKTDNSEDDPKEHSTPSGGLLARMRRVRIMGLKPSPELLAISMVYCVQGILGLSRLALSFFFKDDLHVEPAEAAALMGLSSLPWMIKPLYGFISDTVPLFGYRRRSYLVMCGLLGASSWTLLALWVDSPQTAIIAMLMASLSTAFSDVVVDSIVVERSRGAPQATTGSLQSLCWASAAIGGIASAYFSGSLVQEHGSRFVFGLTAMFPLAVSMSSLLITEAPVTRALVPGGVAVAGPPLSQRLTSQCRSLWSAISRKEILLPTTFVFMWQATPSAETALFYFYTSELGFTPEFLGRVRLAGSIASLVGVGLYNTCFKSVPIRTMLTGAMLLGVALGSTTLILITGLNRTWGISDQVFLLGDSVILTVLGQVSFMPILVLAARLCPEGVEATLFAALMSISNAGASVGSALGAALTAGLGVTSTEFKNLALLVLLCNLASLWPAPFLGLLPKESQQQVLGEGKQDEGGDRGEGEDGDGGMGGGSGDGAMRRQADREQQLELKGLLDGVERGDTHIPR